MPAEAHKQKIEARTLSWLLPAGSLLFLLAVFVVVTALEKDGARLRAERMLAEMKEVCQKYDDYQLSSRSKDLQTVINKAAVLSLYMDREGLSREEALRQYADNQYLSGVIVLDGALEVTANVDLAGEDNEALRKAMLGSGQIQEIIIYPQKVFADSIQLNGREYFYAAAARQDTPGVIICYSDATLFPDDKYEISLNNLLNVGGVSSGTVLVVTDGTEVISTNNEALQGLTVEECPITDVRENDLMKKDSEFLQLHNDGQTWYGVHDSYRSYYLYIFYDSGTVFAGRGWWMCGAVLLCLLVSMGIYMYRQRRQREKLQQVEREFHLVNAIASIYIINLLIRLDKNSWEPILETDYLRRTIGAGGSASEMLDRIREEMIVPHDREEFRKFADLHTMANRLHGKRFVGGTFENVDGRWYQMLLIPQGQTGDRVTSVMLLMRNISEQRQKEIDHREELQAAAERAEFANAAKTDFLRRMSHDIRTPINGVRGMAQIGLQNADDPRRVRDCFRKILTSSDFLLELVNNVLDMSKLESGEMELEQEPFDLCALLDNVVTVIGSQAADAGIDFGFEPFAGQHSHLIGSPLSLQRVLQNIMANAVKYNHPGGSVHVTCREERCDGERAVFCFTCADTGIGMSSEFQKVAFDTFAQEHKSARSQYTGTGLGLPIAKRSVELMGGTLDFVSEEGKGTTFTAHIPFLLDRSFDERKAQQGIKKDDISGVRVLVAEDNALNLEIATYMLTSRSAVVTAVKNGKQAVETFSAAAPGSFDVILMDIMMPEMNGIEAAKAIRALPRPDAAAIPIIAVTANAFSDDVAASRAAGMNTHLSKPLDFGRVVETIREYCRKRPE